MKKFYLTLCCLFVLNGCSHLDQYMNVSANASAQEKFRACALTEAQTKLKNGTLFAQDMSLKKMALEAAGIDSEAQSITSGILNSLQGLK